MPSSARRHQGRRRDVRHELIEVNSDYKPEKELANVQDLAAKGVDAIIVITAGAAGSAASIKAANDAKIPIFFIAGKPQINARR